jgi:hypothetical protein
MIHSEVNRFDDWYQRHLRLLKLQGKRQKTIDAYSRALRRVGDFFDCCPDQLTPEIWNNAHPQMLARLISTPILANIFS